MFFFVHQHGLHHGDLIILSTFDGRLAKPERAIEAQQRQGPRQNNNKDFVDLSVRSLWYVFVVYMQPHKRSSYGRCSFQYLL